MNRVNLLHHADSVARVLRRVGLGKVTRTVRSLLGRCMARSLTVEVDGETVAEVGPGSIIGERAILEGGRRTATLRAMTPVRVAVAGAGQVDLDALAETAKLHHREDRAAREGEAS
jgi:hypothetical protein